MGWTQQRIADAKGVAQNTVAWRLKLHDETSDKVKESICQKLIDEDHLYEIFQLSVDRYLSPWLSTGVARQELIDKAIAKKKKNAPTKTTKGVRKDVKGNHPFFTHMKSYAHGHSFVSALFI